MSRMACSVPMFNDKHLSWKWSWAKEMVDTAREMNFPYLAGSSLPVTWRMPAIDMPYGANVEEVMCVAIGGVDSYDFHALEVIQCMAERRAGGETGVAWVEALRGDTVWKAMESGSWQLGGWSPDLIRSMSLPQSHTCSAREFQSSLSDSRADAKLGQRSHRLPISVQRRFEGNDAIDEWVGGDFTFAARLKDQEEPLSTLFYLPPNPNVTYSAALMAKAEETFLQGKAAYPVERTLLTSGLVEAGVQSLARGRRVTTPYMKVRYQAPRESTFART